MSALYITVRGVIGTDPVLRESNGQASLWFRMVSNERKHDSARGWVDGYTSWFSVRCWGDLAVNVHQSVRKGDRIIALGKLRVSEYLDAQGVKRSSVDLAPDAVGPDLRFATAQSRPVRRQPAPEDHVDRLAEQFHRELEDLPRLSPAELIAQRAAEEEFGSGFEGYGADGPYSGDAADGGPEAGGVGAPDTAAEGLTASRR
jgi:single-strand DNA-binding protein